MRVDLVPLFFVKGWSLLVGNEIKSYWGPMSGLEEDLFFTHTQSTGREQEEMPHLTIGDISDTNERISIELCI
jgi:hypothetical protein